MPPKAQHHRNYQALPEFLRKMREDAGLTQRALAELLNQPQSYVYKSETSNRRVDVTEFITWAQACGHAPEVAFAQYLQSIKR